jgi:superfamily II DNA/RNA helicase
LFAILKRVKIEHLGECEMDDLAARLRAEPQTLAIVDTKAQAAELALKLNDNARRAFHLSTNMCPVHRREILALVKTELEAKKEILLVSTSLIEAGVDIDFPVVYRALSGLDSVAQAAGRCNREGGMEGLGVTYTFILPFRLQGDRYNRRVICQDLIKENYDLLSPEATAIYFNKLYPLGKMDSENILQDIDQEAKRFLFPYRTVARKYKFIDDDGRQPLLIPFNDKARAAFEKLRNGGGDRFFYRSLGQWMVNIRPQDFKSLHQSGAIAPLDRGGTWHELVNDSLYDKMVGLRVDDPYFMKIESGII